MVIFFFFSFFLFWNYLQSKHHVIVFSPSTQCTFLYFMQARLPKQYILHYLDQWSNLSFKTVNFSLKQQKVKIIILITTE